jgi:hypothetical protein
MKKVQDPVIHALELETQLVNGISQVVGFRPSQFAPHCSQTVQAHAAFDLGFFGSDSNHSRKGTSPFASRNSCIVTFAMKTANHRFAKLRIAASLGLAGFFDYFTISERKGRVAAANP